jgi:hypothetical protein
MKTQYVFDIETVALSEEDVLALMPEFNPDEIKIGNRKPENAEAYIEQKRLEHKARFMERAALSALTGRVMALGIYNPTTEDKLIVVDDERKLIETFFQRFETGLGDLTQWIGFRIADFDIPFLMRRAWALNIPVPARALVKGRYLTNWFVDLAELWRASSRDPELISLDRLARFLGVGSKTNSGAAFAALLYENQEAAIEYLSNDLVLTWKIAERLGVIRPAEAEAASGPDLTEPAGVGRGDGAEEPELEAAVAATFW